MKKENASEGELETGKDYINKDGLIVIDRLGGYGNRGFCRNNFEHDLFCSSPYVWREATKEEVIKAFEGHLIHRYGEDWETMKIKEKHPDSSLELNDGSWNVEISKEDGGWNVWNENGLLYCDGIWVERLEEKGFEKITIKEVIKENTVIHCETEEEANRVLGMAHELGYKWHTGENYENDTEWNIYKSTMCYYLFDGSYSDCDYFKNRNYTIIPSTQIADFEERESTDWTPAQEELIEEKKPLFTTEDGVECFDGDEYISIGNNFRKIDMVAYNCDAPYSSDVIRFKHESNADEYIWKNKPVFSYEDFIRWGNVPYERVIMQLAKERV